MTSTTLEALDDLLSPVEATSAAIIEGIEKRAKAEEVKLRMALAATETKRVPLAAEHRQSWDEIRALPEVAPLIAEGFVLDGVERDFVGRRVAVLGRIKPEVTV